MMRVKSDGLPAMNFEVIIIGINNGKKFVSPTRMKAD
jgi:hypothetical protein